MQWSQALWGGFSSFFSIWQACILQISPFFLAYIVSNYLVGGLLTNASTRSLTNALTNKQSIEKSTNYNYPGLLRWAAIPSCFYILGFAPLFALFSSTGLDIGRALSSQIYNLRITAGVVLLFLSCYLIFIEPLKEKVGSMLLGPKLFFPLALFPFLLGITFAIVYSPCITPTMSKILQLSTRPDTAANGFLLAFNYGLGMGLSFALVGLALILLVRKIPLVMSSLRNRRVTKNVCAVILAALALMNIMGVMVYYKAFFLGLFV